MEYFYYSFCLNADRGEPFTQKLVSDIKADIKKNSFPLITNQQTATNE